MILALGYFKNYTYFSLKLSDRDRKYLFKNIIGKKFYKR